jgi:hypothetical protein
LSIILNTVSQTYFRKAAELGDPDAQQELAFCLANGKGCKKDRKEAAKWYRDAVRPFYMLIGSGWLTILFHEHRLHRVPVTLGLRGYTKRSSWIEFVRFTHTWLFVVRIGDIVFALWTRLCTQECSADMIINGPITTVKDTQSFLQVLEGPAEELMPVDSFRVDA